MEYELYHHGIKGQKWGDRRFQNEDGSLTPAGRERYGLGLERLKGLASQARTMISGSSGSNTSASTRTGIPTKKDLGVKIATPIRSTEFWSNKNDPDRQRLEKMSDAEYEQNRITGTDFYMFTRPDGSRFMVEEDLRWEIPPGMSDQAAVKMGQAEIDASREKNKKLAAIAQDVIAGKYGNGEERKKALGSQYKEVQSLVNEILWSKAKHSDSSGYELYHHGILGQKWGKRLYQYEDGTYTELGKMRRRIGERANKIANNPKVKRAFDQNVKQGKDKPNTSPAEKIGKSAIDITTRASNIARRSNKLPKEDLSKYSDADLQKMINRMRLEQQYDDLKSSQINVGSQKVANALDTIGDVAAIGASAATILSMILMIKNGK